MTTPAPNALANAVENVQPDAAPAPAADAPAPASRTFDDRMKAVFDGMQAELAAPPEAPPLPTPSSAPAPAPQITTTPQSDAAPAATAGGGVSASPPAVASPAPPAPPPAAAPVVNNDVAAALQLLAQQQAQQAQINAALYARLAPPQPAPAALPDEPPTLEQAVADYRMPQRNAGEAEDTYAARVQADVYNHAQGKQRQWFVQKAKQIADEAANGVRNELAARAQADVAARNYVNLVGSVVNEVGYKGQTPVATMAFNYADRALTSLHARGITRDWGEQQWRAATQHFVREFATGVPPPPAAGAAPPLALVPNAPGVPAPSTSAGPPIANGGQGTSVPNAPPNKATNKPKSFDEAIENVWKSMQGTG